MEKLSEMYNFDASEALDRLNKKNEKKGGSRIPLTFCGKIEESWCVGVRLNHGIYSKCQKERTKTGYCSACKKQLDSKGMLTYGTIHERAKCENPLDYKDHKGKQVVPYGNVMQKLNISREKVEALAKELGWDIPEEQFQVRTLKKGRPRKKKNANEPPKEKKPRGRPRKDKKVVASAEDTDDLISSLVEQAKATSTESNEEPQVEPQAEQQVEPQVEPQAEPQVEQQVEQQVEPQVEQKDPPKAKKPRGRPRGSKNKPKEIDQLILETKQEDGRKKLEEAVVAVGATLTPPPKDAELEEEEDELGVEEVEYGGVTYLQDDDMNLYDINTHEPLEKKWDPDQECLV